MLELNLTGKRRITYRHTIKRKCLCCGKIFEKPAWYGKGYYCSDRKSTRLKSSHL